MVCGNLTSVCGWQELVTGNLAGSAFAMFDNALAGWTVAILFLVFHFMLYFKTKSLNITWVTGIIFAALYAGSAILKPISMQIIVLILIIEIAGIIYMAFQK